MARLTRVEQQALTRRRIIDAATEEFAQRGYRDATVGSIADRAELTHGAVYSNFPGKRALFFAVLAELAEGATKPPIVASDGTLRGVLRGMVEGYIPMATTIPHTDFRAAVMGADLMSEIMAAAETRVAFAQAQALQVALLTRALERLPGVDPGLRDGRLGPVARAALMLINGGSILNTAAPETYPRAVMADTAAALADIAPGPAWQPVDADAVVVPRDEPFEPVEVPDFLTGEEKSVGPDGVVLVAGLQRLDTVDNGLRSLRIVDPDAPMTVVVVTSAPELMPLVELTLRGLGRQLLQAVPPTAMPDITVTADHGGALAARLGAEDAGDRTECAVLIVNGRVRARAVGEAAAASLAQWLERADSRASSA